MSGLDVFFSYSHQDEELRDELEVHLSLLKRQGTIHAWHDRRIIAGQKWEDAIDENLEQADVIHPAPGQPFLHRLRLLLEQGSQAGHGSARGG